MEQPVRSVKNPDTLKLSIAKDSSHKSCIELILKRFFRNIATRLLVSGFFTDLRLLQSYHTRLNHSAH